MAYDNTSVPVSRSQEAIRKLIMAHGGFGLAMVSERDPHADDIFHEGFQAKVLIDQKSYTVKVMATITPPRKTRRGLTSADPDKETRRVWRVLFYHMKSVFEAADSGVMEFRELMLPYIVTGNRMTIAERLLPALDEIVNVPDASRLLVAGEMSA
jgi:hypothetical protein